jgi:dTDP-4-amino-4,6-dideoxygalactose transaminase
MTAPATTRPIATERSSLPAAHDLAIPVFQPYLGPEVHQAASDALTAGWLGMGKLTREFENQLSDYLGLDGRYLVTTSSCTEAIFLSAKVAGIGAGDEVICPSFTYVAGHQAISATGADVVFCDVRESDLGIDVASAASMIGPRTKAIMAVHYAGMPCDLDGVYALAREHGLRVIEDAAHAFGTTHNGHRIGADGDLTCFSFGPVKVITSLEGGAVVTSSEEEYTRLQQLRILGVDTDTYERYKNSRAWVYDVSQQGYRMHLGSVPAAIGLSQLAKVDEFIANRQDYCRYYHERLAAVPELTLLQTDFRNVSPFIYVVRVPDGDVREEFMAHLAARGIGTGIHFLGAHEFSFYRNQRRAPLPVTERVSDQVVTLPLHPYMTRQVLDTVVGAITSYFSSS